MHKFKCFQSLFNVERLANGVTAYFVCEYFRYFVWPLTTVNMRSKMACEFTISCNPVVAMFRCQDPLSTACVLVCCLILIFDTHIDNWMTVLITYTLFSIAPFSPVVAGNDSDKWDALYLGILQPFLLGNRVLHTGPPWMHEKKNLELIEPPPITSNICIGSGFLMLVTYNCSVRI